jgi:hypothetical protein
MQRWLATLTLGCLVLITPAVRADVAPPSKRGGCAMTERSSASWALAALPAVVIALWQRRRVRR